MQDHLRLHRFSSNHCRQIYAIEFARLFLRRLNFMLKVFLFSLRLAWNHGYKNSGLFLIAPESTMPAADDLPPKYRQSLPPGSLAEWLYILTIDYLDDKPSISLMGVIPSAFGDISSPPSGRGLVAADLRDFDARRRFGAFGSTFVELERLRQAREFEKSKQKPRDTFNDLSEHNVTSAVKNERESHYEKSCVTRKFVKMYQLYLSWLQAYVASWGRKRVYGILPARSGFRHCKDSFFWRIHTQYINTCSGMPKGHMRSLLSTNSFRWHLNVFFTW